jgi:branched-subunit amino acid transport protein
MTAWVAVVLVGALSLGFRWLPLVMADRLRIDETRQSMLLHAGVAAMTALTVNAVVSVARTGPPVAVVVALGIGVVLSWRGAEMIWVVLGGGSAYGLVTLLSTLT